MEISIDIRRAMRADIPALMRMKRALLALEGLTDFPCATAQDWLRDAIATGSCCSAVVAAQEGVVVGMATYNRKQIPGVAASILYLQDLFVDEDHRRLGIARRLLQHVAGEAVEQGATLIELNVAADNPAREFYQRIGFQPVPQCLTYVLAGPPLVNLTGLSPAADDAA